MRDVESLCERRGAEVSKSSAARICTELRELSGVELVPLFLDAMGWRRT